jgi:hypothetical protein
MIQGTVEGELSVASFSVYFFYKLQGRPVACVALQIPVTGRY